MSPGGWCVGTDNRWLLKLLVGGSLENPCGLTNSSLPKHCNTVPGLATLKFAIYPAFGLVMMAGFTGDFDPYHKWLGIPPRDQPPHHYRLLGLERFETDEDVIEAAASRLIAFCEQNAHGPHAPAARRVVFEIAAARLCLLDPEQRAAYDANLKAQQAAAPRHSAGVTRNPAARAGGKVDRRTTPPPRAPAAPPIPSPPDIGQLPFREPRSSTVDDAFDFEAETSVIGHSGNRPKGFRPLQASQSAELDEMLAGPTPAPPAPMPRAQTPPAPAPPAPTPAVATRPVKSVNATRASGAPPTPSSRSKATGPPVPAPLPDGIEDFLGSLDEPSTVQDLFSAHATQDKHGKTKEKSRQSLVMLGAMTALAVLLIVVGAWVLMRSDPSSDQNSYTQATKTEERDPILAVVAKSADEQAAINKPGDSESMRQPNDDVASFEPAKSAAIAKTVLQEDTAKTARATKETALPIANPSQRLLELCADGGSAAEADKLLAEGANLEQTDLNRRTPLRLAVMGKDLPLVHVLLAAKAEVNTRDAAGETPLMSAVQHGDAKLVLQLIEAGADPKLATSGKDRKGGGTTPLHVAARQGHTEVALLLLEHEAPVDAANQEGVTPLMVAAWQGHVDTATALIEKGADVKAALDAVGQTPLMYAARGGSLEIVDAMLKAGAQIGFRSKSGSTARTIAESLPNPNQQLIDKLRPRDRDEAPPLDF